MRIHARSQSKGIAFDTCNYRTAVNVLAEDYPDVARILFRQAHDKGALGKPLKYEDGCIDVHGFPVKVAEVAIEMVLEENPESAPHQIRDLFVDPGKGIHSKDGIHKMLEEVPKMFNSHGLLCELQRDSDNVCFKVTAHDLRQ